MIILLLNIALYCIMNMYILYCADNEDIVC